MYAYGKLYKLITLQCIITDFYYSNGITLFLKIPILLECYYFQDSIIIMKFHYFHNSEIRGNRKSGIMAIPEIHNPGISENPESWKSGISTNSPIVCAVLALDSWNYCSGEQA